MTDAEYAALQARLRALADPDYLAFHQKLVPTVHNLLGVRVPALRALARELAKGDWRGYLAAAGTGTYEETMLQGLVLGLARMDVEEFLERLDAFVPKVDNWAVCDSACAGFKLVRRHRERVLAEIAPWLQSPEEFRVRVAAVLLMDHFLVEEYGGRVLELLAGVRHEGYYARMAAAWALSVCLVKFEEPTMALLRSGGLEPEIRRMALQKALESGRVGADAKAELRRMRAACRE